MNTAEHLQARGPGSDVATLTLSEAASVLRVHPATVRRWIGEGRLSAYQVRPGGQYRIARVTVEMLLNERKAA